MRSWMRSPPPSRCDEQPLTPSTSGLDFTTTPLPQHARDRLVLLAEVIAAGSGPLQEVAIGGELPELHRV